MLLYQRTAFTGPACTGLWQKQDEHFVLVELNGGITADLGNITFVIGSCADAIFVDYPEIMHALQDAFHQTEPSSRQFSVGNTTVEIAFSRLDDQYISSHITPSLSPIDDENALDEREFVVQMLNSLGQSVVVLDMGWHVVYVNQAFTNLTGYTPEELIGQTPHDFVYPEELERLKRVINMKPLRHIPSREFRFLHKEGYDIPTLVTGTSRKHDGVMLGLYIVITDLTELHRTNQALYDSEMRHRALLDAIPDTMFLQDNDGIYLDYYSGENGIVNRDPSTFLNHSMQDVLPENVVNIIEPAFKEAVISRKMHTVEYTINSRRRGSQLHYEARMVPYTEDRVLVIVRDVTESRNTELELAQSELRYRRVVDSIPDMIYVHHDEKVVYINPAGVKLFGASSPEQVIGLGIYDLLAPEYHEVVRERIANFLNQLNASPLIEEEFLGVDGRRISVEVMAVPIDYMGQSSVMVIARDIRDRKRDARAIALNEQRFRSVFASASVGIAITDEQGYPIEFNGVFGRLFGYGVEELHSKSIIDFTHTHDRMKDKKLFYELVQGKIDRYQLEKRFVHKNGHIIWARSHVSRLPMADEKQRTQIIFLLDDISEQKKAEADLRRLNETLEVHVDERTAELKAANDRLTELDRLKNKFIADMSHELRTPISVLNTRIYLLERAGAEKLEQYLPGMKVHINRLIEFTENILELTRLDLREDKVKFKLVDLRSIVQSVVDVALPEDPEESITLTFEPLNDDEVPDMTVRGEPGQLSQVVTNLVQNAIKYTDHGTISVCMIYDKTQSHVGFSVTDTGIGIAETDIPHLFERFYRGENASQSTTPGTGLGLSIVQEIVQLHHGAIAVESTLGEGTNFTITFPHYQIMILDSHEPLG